MAAMRRAALTVLLLCGAAIATGGVWLDVPFVKQEKDGCGSASIAMVMQYWAQQQGRAAGPVAEAPAIQRVLYSREAHGIYASDLQKYFDEQGFRTFTFRGDWDELQDNLNKGRPLIVALKPSGGNAPLHYLVVVGFDWQEGVILVNDPAQRKLLKEDRSRFEKQWNAAGKWTLLAVPEAKRLSR
jgi:ABC-type bacteriocin/lantibiotic exporter with double-glycine peptidase domain